MEIRLGKWASYLSLRTLRTLTAQLSFSLNATVEIASAENRQIVAIVKLCQAELDAILVGITNSNLHWEINTGPSVGGR